MRIAMPEAAVRRIPLGTREEAVREFARIIGGIRDAPAGAAADLEAIAGEAVDTATREGALLMAVVEPDGAAPALLTGVALDVPAAWDTESAETLRDSVEDVGGPDVRETVVLQTGYGPAVVAQRVPGVEQARDRRPLTLQLQAFIPEPGTGRMLLLTLACPSLEGWSTHQQIFGEIVRSAGREDHVPETAVAAPSPAAEAAAGPVEVQRAPSRPVRSPIRATRRPAPAAEDDESFEHHTFRLD